MARLLGKSAVLYKHTAAVAHTAASIATVVVPANKIGTLRGAPSGTNTRQTASVPIAGDGFVPAEPTIITDNTTSFQVTVDAADTQVLAYLVGDSDNSPGLNTSVTYAIVYPGTPRFVAFADAKSAGFEVTADHGDVVQATINVARQTKWDYIPA